MRSIYTIGETTFDIVFKNEQPILGIVGGSALNTAVSLGRAGLPIHFISRLGNDRIGNLALKLLIENGINTGYITRFEGNSRISLAFMDENNNAEYQFYQAGLMPDLHYPVPVTDDIISFGSTLAIQNEGRGNLLGFLKEGLTQKAITIYDPNIRQKQENKLAGIRVNVEENFRLTTILKGSAEDFEKLYGVTNPEEIFQKVQSFGIQTLIITSGDNPVQLITERFSKKYPVEMVQPVSTIGCGDNFTAGMIAGMYQLNVRSENINSIPIVTWDQIIQTGNSFASEVCRSDMNYISEEFASKFRKTCQ
ncbi:MAG TPA: PfkB family carbohydrate kinase [Prolixibacteraceae bacterium]|nr:PfkB family carbohydrate kinase [Prolixibacteraceae bacterium]